MVGNTDRGSHGSWFTFLEGKAKDRQETNTSNKDAHIGNRRQHQNQGPEQQWSQ